MKRISLVLASLLSLAGIAALAETPDPSGQFPVTIHSGKTPVELRGELKEAQRTGDIQAAGEGGTEYERNPQAFPPRPVVPGKTREQVRTETLQAVHDGDIPYGELGLTERQLFPQQYAARAGWSWRRQAANARQTVGQP
jgi:hypothetical protein